MDQKNGPGEIAQDRVTQREVKDSNPALPRMPAIQLPPERVDETCLLLMRYALDCKRNLQTEKEEFLRSLERRINDVDRIVSAIVGERARLQEGDTVDGQGNIIRGKKSEPAPVP